MIYNTLKSIRKRRLAAMARLAGCVLSVWLVSIAQAQTINAPNKTVVYPVQGTDTGELTCRIAPSVATKPAAAEPNELPSNEEINSLTESSGAIHKPDSLTALVKNPQQNFKIAIFGDSHLAAGVFSRELMRLSQLPDDQIATRIIPASVERAGVRVNIRKVCSLGRWGYEAAYVGNDAATFPGPGLATAQALSTDAGFIFDLRDAQGMPVVASTKILYHQTVEPQKVTISIDSGEELTVDLPAGPPAPAVIEVRSPKAISTLALRTVSLDFRWQGLELPPRTNTRLTIDSFGYPGATVASFQKINSAYFSQWFIDNPYNVVVLWYGTNEGNVPNFDGSSYASLLNESLSKVRQLFPSSQCILLSPGDRGVVSRITRGKHRKRLKMTQRRAALLKFSLIHAQIATIQAQIANQYGCSAFNLQRAMGGNGSAYRWYKSQPRKMAVDLIHFTPLGYRELADDFANAIHWRELWSEGEYDITTGEHP